MKNLQCKIFLLFLISFLIIQSSAFALNIEKFQPHFDNLGLVNLLSSKNLEKRSFSSGLGFSYAHEPLELGEVGTSDRLDSLIDYEVNMTLTTAYGITDWVEVGIAIPFFPNLKIEPIGTSTGSSSAAFGDIGIFGKLHLADLTTKQFALGFALSPYLTLPSGSTKKYTGDANITGGLRVVGDATINDNVITSNLGFRLREKENLLNLPVGQELLYGFGFNRPIYQTWDLHALTEVNGTFTFNSFGSRENRNPMEWTLGIKKGLMASRLNITGGFALGLTNGYGIPSYRLFSMVSYVAPSLKPKTKTPMQSETTIIEKRSSYNSYVRLENGMIVILEPIHFETAKWIILPESLPVVQAVADLMISQPQLLHVVVKGHTDGRGSDSANMALSQNRAQAVINKLVEFGVTANRLTAEGWGERQPIAENTTPIGMAKNRRVEFHIVEIQEVKPSNEIIEKHEETIRR